MTQTANNYGTVLFELGVEKETVEEMKRIFSLTGELPRVLDCPVVSGREKHRLIEQLFPKEVWNFLKEMCDHGNVSEMEDVFKAYTRCYDEANGILKTVMYCAGTPDEEQLAQIKAYLAAKHHRETVELTICTQPELIGGFVLETGDLVEDYSVRGRIKNLEQKLTWSDDVGSINSEEIISILKTEIENYDMVTGEQEVGSVIWVGDGIATIYGIEHAMYGEIVIFENGVRGMVQDIKRDQIGCIILGKDTGVKEGTKVTRTKKKAGVPVGNAYLGRIVNALGAPIDGKGDIPADDYRPIEQEAPGIVDRQSVKQPLETGILAIDAMFPIGRGQRELIIGDRQTGKTSIAVDTILNQKGKDVICIYVAIGQKASTVAKLVNTLTKNDAMDYSIILSSTASESASLQYIAPYAGTAMAEYFMHQGKDVLIVYDDLSKHAVAYRALSLLLERSPGREAYPGDVFYLHSRLLERSSKLSDELGGGSITALPIIETQAGDVSAYIPTNVISITDGQIFLESDLFFSGMRPAVNVGLSVSRVGGAAQTKAMKKASGTIRIDLAQYREMEVFTQFASDLDDMTKEQLQHGKCLMELLKQPLCHPMSLADQVITLVAANKRLMLDVDTAKTKEFQLGMLDYIHVQHAELVTKINEEKVLDDAITEQIVEAVKEYKSR